MSTVCCSPDSSSTGLDEAPSAASSDCPYRGLQPFGVDDEDLFFGRDADIAAALARLARSGFLAVSGASVDGVYVGARTVLNTPDLACFKYQRRFVLEGHVFFADRYDPDSQTLVEFDSARFHGTPEQRAYDAWRDELFRRAGYDTVRLPYPDVVHSPRACRAKVRAKVAERLAGAPPPSAS